MNILEVEDMIKGLPDQALQQEAQAPTGQVPQFLVISEIQRRTDMRKRFQQEQQPQGTVADQIVQEGVMSVMPPQAMVPQAMPPQGMPPQQMFSGGIIRLQGGGFLDQQTASGAGTVRSQVERALQEGASMADLLTIFRNQPEAIELVKQLVADRQRGQISLPDLGQTDVTLPDRRRGEGVASARESYAPQEINLPSVSIPSMEDLVSSARGALPAPPSGESVESAGRQAGEGLVGLMRNMLPEAPERGQTPDLAGRYAEQLLSIQDALPDSPSVDMSPLSKSFSEAASASLEGAASRRQGVADLLSGLEDSLTPESVRRARRGLPVGRDPLMFQSAANQQDLGPFQGYYDQMMDLKPGQVAAPDPLSEELLLGMPSNDASKKRDGVGLLYEDDGIPQMLSGAGSKEVQGTSPIQNQGRPDKTEPSLDFSDLIKESKDAAMANALMQLGAGIAGGDLSKGISAAGVAAAKGQQDAKAIAIRKRLAEYQAGREDIAREEKGRQFDEQMELLEKKIDATLTASTATSQREGLRALAGEVASLRENLAIMSDSEKARFRVLEQQLYSMLGIDMPRRDVVAGIPAGESGEWGIAGR